MITIKKIPVIAVMGSGTDEHQEKAGILGRWIAEQDYHLLTGGGRGIMTSVSRAFCQVEGRRGLSIGIIPGRAGNDGYAVLEGYPNPWIETAIYTHLPLSGAEGTTPLSRNHINILSADLIIALPGQLGTKSEIQLAIRYKKPLLAFFRDSELVFGEKLNIECIADFEKLTKRILTILKK